MIEPTPIIASKITEKKDHLHILQKSFRMTNHKNFPDPIIVKAPN